ncbi:hypothetical protein OpiT1DRAFT_03442 [Opitutaceae bacterium TAV1]|nr:hypothetical protein OpiT1DRAFT_03442 [Opitutaceae bacterium TAV1]
MSKKKSSKSLTPPAISLIAYKRNDDEKQLQERAVGQLYLDPKNPRLAEVSHTGTQASIQKVLEDQFDLQPLKDSLYRNGFFYEEPLVAIYEPLTQLKGKKVLVVIEGNRRLAALKSIFSNPSEFPDVAARKRLENIPIVIRTDREETLPFIGFRHITGIVPWESAAKAQYALRLIKGGHTVDGIAHVIGNKTRDIERWIRTQSIIEKANELGLKQEDAAKGFYFSYLLTTTDAPATKKWLKLETDPHKGTVKSIDSDRLTRLWGWLYGSKDEDTSPVITESRQIHKLNRVLAFSNAVRELEKTGNLERSFAHTKSREEYLAESLSRIRSELQDIVAAVSAEGKLEQDENNKEHVQTTKKELKQVETVLGNLRTVLGL